MSSICYPVPSDWKNTAHVNLDDYRASYGQSCHDPETFWGQKAASLLTWFSPWEKVLSGGLDLGDVQWFTGGQLNASFNCLDRHLSSRANQAAIIWEGDTPEESRVLTYQALYQDVCRLANVLKARGVKRGDRICIYLPMIPEAVIAMLACARIGVIHSVVFAGFSAEALKDRLLDAGCSVVITADAGKRGGKLVALKENVDEALSACPLVNHVIVVKHTHQPIDWQVGRDVWYHDELAKASDECEAAIMNAEDPLFILYTSGSTGKPKGILHATGGYLLYAAFTFQTIFDYRPGDIYWCTADVGWITGHSYGVYGPLANGATVLIFEGTPQYPTPARFWEIVDQYRVNLFYTAPTAIRALRREGDQWVKQTQRNSLRLLGTVGEPINPAAWLWYYEVVGQGRCPIVDTWWQTETGGIMISPLPGATPLKPGSAAWPFFGIVPDIVDEQGQALPAGKMGQLVIKKPWPGMMKTIYGDHQRFLQTYLSAFPGCYLTGDQAYRDEDGYFWIVGRSDDVIKISGHRIGTGEVESALILHPAVSEAAVVPVQHPIKGQSIYAYVTLKSNCVPSPELTSALIQTVRDHIGPIATPDHIQYAEGLPKTRSGKIMRRLLRKIANHETDELGDLSTLADPSVIQALIKAEGGE